MVEQCHFYCKIGMHGCFRDSLSVSFFWVCDGTNSSGRVLLEEYSDAVQGVVIFLPCPDADVCLPAWTSHDFALLIMGCLVELSVRLYYR
jgi:hypothetical protein